LTRRRAAALGHAPAASAPGGTVLLALPDGTEADFLRQHADPGAAVVAFGLLAEAIHLLAGGRAAGTGLRWLVVLVASIALCLDWVDGYLARRLGTATGFGARFDMETDAVMILALAALAWTFGQAGPWVLASGLLRYIFVISGRLWPVLTLPLPPRKRRQSLCVAQAIALILALAPPVTPIWGTAICLAGLGFLS
jgi:phosphatidylglycerophosphate synthase